MTSRNLGFLGRSNGLGDEEESSEHSYIILQCLKMIYMPVFPYKFVRKIPQAV